MIKERYCSPEVAKLLKEKGFNEECRAAYTNYGKLFTTQIQQYVTNNLTGKGRLWECSAPTQSMAIDWLREVHNIFIIVEPYSNTSCYFSLWEGNDIYRDNPLRKSFPSYEETVEEALKYVLENLI